MQHVLIKWMLCSQRTGVDSDKIQVAIQVPTQLTYNMDRFVKECGKIPVNGHLRSPFAFGHAQTEAEAQARMQVQLLEFDEKFGRNNGSSGGDTRFNK